MTDVLKQLQDSINGIMDQDFLPEHFKGRKLEDLDFYELKMVEAIINHETHKLQNLSKKSAKAKRVKELKDAGRYIHIQMIKLNTKALEMIEQLAEQKGVHPSEIINRFIEQGLGLGDGESLPIEK